MNKTKTIIGILLTAMLLIAQSGTVFAAPQAQDTTLITGTITAITIETDELDVTTVLVTVADEMENEQTYRLSLETAIALGLVTQDPITMELSVNETQIGTPVEIDPEVVVPEEEPTEEPEESNHPISEILAAFFGEDASMIDGYHDDGFGFGVIAQSLWMSQNVGGDATLAGEILEAKETGDFSAFFPEGTEDIPTNWGQFKKALSEKKNNLGWVVSGHADDDGDTDTLEEQSQPGNGNGNNNGKGNDNKDKENKGKGNGKNK